MVVGDVQLEAIKATKATKPRWFLIAIVLLTFSVIDRYYYFLDNDFLVSSHEERDTSVTRLYDSDYQSQNVTRKNEACPPITCGNLPDAFVIGFKNSLLLNETLKQFQRVGIELPTVVESVDEKLIVKQLVEGPSQPKGEVSMVRLGLTASHATAWKHIVDANLPGGLVFEDDVVFHNDFCDLLPKYWSKLPCDPSFVYIGSDIRADNGKSIVHRARAKGDAPPWDAHAYYVDRETADLLLRRFRYYVLRLNVTIPGKRWLDWRKNPITRFDRGWDVAMAEYDKRMPPLVVHQRMVNADFFIMNQFHYFLSSSMRKRWAWFDSTTSTPGSVGSFTMSKSFKSNDTLLPFSDSCITTACNSSSDQKCLILFNADVNPYGTSCQEASSIGYRPIVRGVGLVFQAKLWKCEDVRRRVEAFVGPHLRTCGWKNRNNILW